MLQKFRKLRSFYAFDHFRCSEEIISYFPKNINNNSYYKAFRYFHINVKIRFKLRFWPLFLTLKVRLKLTLSKTERSFGQFSLRTNSFVSNVSLFKSNTKTKQLKYLNIGKNASNFWIFKILAHLWSNKKNYIYNIMFYFPFFLGTQVNFLSFYIYYIFFGGGGQCNKFFF